MNAMADPSMFEMAQKRGVAWVVVVTKPFQEALAKAELERQGFATYLPMKLFEDRRRQVRAAPFFPRYIFARIDVREDRWQKVWSTRGVSGLLGATATRAPWGVSDIVVERVKMQEDAGFIRMMGPLAARSAQAFAKGEVVRLAGSPLEAVFLEQVDGKRAAILVSLLGRDSRLTVDLSQLRSTLTAEDIAALQP